MTDYDKYETPTELLTDTALSHEEKVNCLLLWRDDEEALIRAAGEGMAGGERPNLKQIQQALETLLGQKET